MSEEEKKAIEYIKEFKNEVFEGVGNKSIMAKNIDILLNLIDKQQRKLKEVEDYITSYDFFNLLCVPEKRKQYFIAHDNLLAILQGDNKE